MTNLMPYRFNRHSDFVPSMMDDFFRPFFVPARSPESFRVDVKDEGSGYLLEAELPGMKKENVHISVDNDVLTIETKTEEKKEERKDNYLMNERRTGCFRRSFTLNGIDETGITAAYEDGILKITLPKAAEEEKTGHEITIQ